MMLVHGIASMNRDHHMVHGDLHANNITIDSFTNMLRIPLAHDRARYILIMNGKRYILPAHILYPCIIDLSRCMCEDPAILTLGKTFADAKAGGKNVTVVQQDVLDNLRYLWKEQLLKKLETTFGGGGEASWYNAHVASAGRLADEKWPDLLRIASCIDIIDMCHSMQLICESFMPDCKSKVAFLGEIVKWCTDTFYSDFDKLNHDEPVASYPSERLFEARWKSREITADDLARMKTKDIVIYGLYNNDTPMKFDGVTKFPVNWPESADTRNKAVGEIIERPSTHSLAEVAKPVKKVKVKAKRGAGEAETIEDLV